MEWKEARILVTGGSGGYGRGIAAVLKEAGAELWITGRDPAKLEKTAAELGVHAIPADVTSGADWDRVMREIGGRGEARAQGRRDSGSRGGGSQPRNLCRWRNAEAIQQTAERGRCREFHRGDSTRFRPDAVLREYAVSRFDHAAGGDCGSRGAPGGSSLGVPDNCGDVDGWTVARREPLASDLSAFRRLQLRSAQHRRVETDDSRPRRSAAAAASGDCAN